VGIGKPELLRENPSTYWLRRIGAEHQLVHRLHGGKLMILTCRYH
jgi:toxin YoeB